jgi:hypothetical protein
MHVRSSVRARWSDVHRRDAATPAALVDSLVDIVRRGGGVAVDLTALMSAR